ncbi:MAG: hypothetical protein AABZ55_04965, partial [Bdellovibrionota bacterium]
MFRRLLRNYRTQCPIPACPSLIDLQNTLPFESFCSLNRGADFYPFQIKLKKKRSLPEFEDKSKIQN